MVQACLFFSCIFSVLCVSECYVWVCTHLLLIMKWHAFLLRVWEKKDCEVYNGYDTIIDVCGWFPHKSQIRNRITTSTRRFTSDVHFFIIDSEKCTLSSNAILHDAKHIFHNFENAIYPLPSFCLFEHTAVFSAYLPVLIVQVGSIQPEAKKIKFNEDWCCYRSDRWILCIQLSWVTGLI
jgi:hypothetical protein